MSKDIGEMWDVVVIGGGPAGMMSAGRIAELAKTAGKPARVLLLEKNKNLGKKLLITGGGRCNVTNAEFDVRKFLSKYKESDKFLFSAFSQFSVKDTLEFFNSRGMPTKIEAENRVFPTSDSAESVWNVLVEYLKQGNVEVGLGAEVSDFETGGGKVSAVKLKSGEKFFARNFVLATGGTSRPETGSTGDGFSWLREIGHKVVPSDASLVPITIEDKWLKRVQGVTLQNIKLTTFQNNQKQEVHKGKILFTHFGISGPTVLNMSKDVGELLKYGNVQIRLDFLPKLNHGDTNLKLQELFKIDDKKKIKNSLGGVVPSAFAPVVLEISGIDPEKTDNAVTREERIKLIDVIKGFPMNVSGLLGTDKAIVSSGGVELTEVDFKTMRSKLFPNLYLVGDILNIDRPSGGYSLQLCWTTGFVAGNSVLSN